MGRNRNIEPSELVDSAAVQDRVFAELRGPDGEIKEIKGPDPAEWGDDADRPDPNLLGPEAAGLEIGEIQNEGTPDEIKGPGPQWETNDQGEFVNRA